MQFCAALVAGGPCDDLVAGPALDDVVVVAVDCGYDRIDAFMMRISGIWEHARMCTRMCASVCVCGTQQGTCRKRLLCSERVKVRGHVYENTCRCVFVNEHYMGLWGARKRECVCVRVCA